MEICEDIRHTTGMRELYGRRKETIERNFGTAKEHHAMRYTQLVLIIFMKLNLLTDMQKLR